MEGTLKYIMPVQLKLAIKLLSIQPCGPTLFLQHLRLACKLRGGILRIGNGTGISNSFITCQKKIEIGNHVLIGANCQIYDTDFHPLESKFRYGDMKDNNWIRRAEVIIEDGVFIGTRCIILKGTRIGTGSIIGAGSVVSGHIPENEIWAGVPARFIKKAE